MVCRIFSYSMWDLVPRPGIEPGTPVLGVGSLSHWTTREVPQYIVFYTCNLFTELNTLFHFIYFLPEIKKFIS